MAGTGEACSHIAALLYATMAKVNLTKETSCTSKVSFALADVNVPLKNETGSGDSLS